MNLFLFQTIPSFNSRIIEASEDTFVTVAEIDLDPRTFVREMHLADGDLLAYKTSDNVFRFRSVAEAGKRVLPDVAAPEATSRLCLTDFGLVVTRPGARVAIVWHWLDVLKVRLTENLTFMTFTYETRDRNKDARAP